MAWSDVLAFYRKHGPERRSYRLGNVLRAEGLRWEGSAHRAEADARDVLAIMRKLADYPAWNAPTSPPARIADTRPKAVL